MAFNHDEVADRLRQFSVKNIRQDESFELMNKRIKPYDVLVLQEKKVLLNCTDERVIKALIDVKNSQEKDVSQYTVARAAGAAFGLVDAVRNVKVTLQREEILQALAENEVQAANHIFRDSPHRLNVQ